MTRKEFINIWGEDLLKRYLEAYPEERNADPLDRNTVYNFFDYIMYDLYD